MSKGEAEEEGDRDILLFHWVIREREPVDAMQLRSHMSSEW